MSPTPTNSAFRALADQTRRDILTILRSRPRTSGDIASQFPSSWPTISRHLSVLANANLVITTRKGAEVYYELNTSVFQDVIQHLIEWTKPESTKRSKSHRVAHQQEG